MTESDERDEAEVAAELRALDEDARLVLSTLAVVGRGSLSADEIRELTALSDPGSTLAELERRRFVVRDGDRYSLAPAEEGRIKRILGSLDTTDRVLRGFVAIAEDGRLTLDDLDAIVELTGIAADAGQLERLVRLTTAAQNTLSTAHRVEAWVAIFERQRDAADAAGDRDAAGRAERELARLRSSVGVGTVTHAGVRTVTAVAAATAAAAVGVAFGLLVGGGGGEGGGETVTVTEVPAAAAGETVTETTTETVTTPGAEIRGETITTTITTTETTTILEPDVVE